jgi:hypothetical protein
MRRFAYIDERALARNFKPEMVVQKAGLRDLLPSPYYGRVLYSDIGNGIVVVQWPWGAEQDYPSELTPIFGDAAVGVMDFNQCGNTYNSDMYSGGNDKSYAAMPARIASAYEQITLPVWRMACREMYRGVSEFEAFAHLSSQFSDEFGSDAVRRTIANLYNAARRMAAYATRRKYKVTGKERTSGIYGCPNCKTPMEYKTYTYNKNQKPMKVHVCPNCHKAIHPKDFI